MSGHAETDLTEAPGELELVRRFVNTYDAEEGTDRIASPSALSAWLSEHGLAAGRPRITQEELDRVVGLREALRGLLLQNNGAAADPDALASANEALRGAALELRFGSDGSADLVPSEAGVDGALARLAAIVREAMLAGEWQRLKVCPADDCLWAFYDRSRNRSRSWCSMEVCGNRAKVRSFRSRQAG